MVLGRIQGFFLERGASKYGLSRDIFPRKMFKIEVFGNGIFNVLSLTFRFLPEVSVLCTSQKNRAASENKIGSWCPCLESPGNVSDPAVKPFLVHLYFKTEKCMHLKLLVWREPLSLLRTRKWNSSVIVRFQILQWPYGPKRFRVFRETEPFTESWQSWQN